VRYSNYLISGKQMKISIPSDVPQALHQEFITNYQAITAENGKLLMLTGDQKLEHLNANFYGSEIHPDVAQPTHLFEIASKGFVTAFVAHLGLIARYGHQYPTINYIVKLNGKTNIIPTQAQDPISAQLWSVEDVITFKQNSRLPIRGIGYTAYLGSSYEATMLREAAQAVFQAHQQGLVAILWMYPRGKYVTDERSIEMVAGAAGVAATLGADFAKINAPKASTSVQQAELLRIAVNAAGSTKLICAGGPSVDQTVFLQQVYNEIHRGHTWGNAIGRNIYQRSCAAAIAYTRALSAIVFNDKTVDEALAIFGKE
jgi:fructose-bisphosphate aldolase / 6-deoxy-5-ketofructose 1-phosphate synthase